MKKKYELMMVAVVGGLAVHGAIAACGNVSSDPDSSVPDAEAADAPAPDSLVGGVDTPAGVIVAYGGTTEPPGWTFCDGKEMSRTTDAALFAAIGILHGDGDGIATFHIPDLRGRFLRGTDHGTGRDPEAATRTESTPGGSTGDAVGSLQDSAVGAHSHTGTTGTEILPSGALGIWYDHPGQNRYTNSGGTGIAQNQTHRHSFTTDSAGGPESRPVNVGVNYIIKL